MKKLNRLQENSERQFNKLKNKINEQWMGLDIITESEVSQTKKDISYDATYMCSLKKKWHKWTYLQNRNRLTDLENKCMVTKGQRGEGVN